MPVKEMTDVRDKILDKLKTEERNLAWLHRKTGLSYSTLYSIFIHRIMDLNQERLELINKAMGAKFKLDLK